MPDPVSLDWVSVGCRVLFIFPVFSNALPFFRTGDVRPFESQASPDLFLFPSPDGTTESLSAALDCSGVPPALDDINPKECNASFEDCGPLSQMLQTASSSGEFARY